MGAWNVWNAQGLSRPVKELIYLLLFSYLNWPCRYQICSCVVTVTDMATHSGPWNSPLILSQNWDIRSSGMFLIILVVWYRHFGTNLSFPSSVSKLDPWRCDRKVTPKRLQLSSNLRCDNIPEEQRFNLHRSRSQKPSIIEELLACTQVGFKNLPQCDHHITKSHSLPDV